MRSFFSISGFFRRSDGTAIIEFAIIAPVFFLIIFGVLEFGLFMYSKSVIEGIAVEISRTASIGKSSGGACSGMTGAKAREDYIRCVVKERAKALIGGDQADVQINTVVAGGTTDPDICFAVTPPSSPAICAGVYEDVNGDGKYNGLAASNAGKPGEAIEVRISYPWNVQFPLMNKFFQTVDSGGNVRHAIMMTSSTVIKNEPFPVN